jgi:hypothetical protein
VTALNTGVAIISVAAMRNSRFRTSATVTVREPDA